jgi:hypothetical protein
LNTKNFLLLEKMDKAKASGSTKEDEQEQKRCKKDFLVPSCFGEEKKRNLLNKNTLSLPWTMGNLTHLDLTTLLHSNGRPVDECRKFEIYLPTPLQTSFKANIFSADIFNESEESRRALSLELLSTVYISNVGISKLDQEAAAKHCTEKSKAHIF